MSALELALARFSNNHDGTLGAIFIGGKFFCFTLEDAWRVVKVPRITRIPEGRYRIKFREVLSPLTQQYRARHPWFTWHLELQEVPDYQHVYLHVGNRPEDTDGCILVGDQARNNQIHPAFIGESTGAFERLYRKVSAALVAGREVWITIGSIEHQSRLPLAA